MNGLTPGTAEVIAQRYILEGLDPRYTYAYVTRMPRPGQPAGPGRLMQGRRLSDADVALIENTKAWRQLPRGDKPPWEKEAQR